MTMRTVSRAIIRAPRRARQWALHTTNQTIVAATHAGQVAFDLLQAIEGDLSAEINNATISALNYNVNYRLTGSTTGDDTTVICAIALVGEDAFGIGGTSLPDPSTDHADWMFWDARTLTSSRDVTDVDEQVFNSQLEIRNRSMRKMRENHQRLAMIVRSPLLQATQVQIFVAGRALVLLP